MLTFGKYRGKTFEHVYDIDINYCDWVVSLPLSNSKNMKDFVAFVNTKRQNEGPRRITNGLINVSALSPCYRRVPEFLDLVNGLNIETTPLRGTLIPETRLPGNTHGVYLDYLIRYQVCCALHREFEDMRCESICLREGYGPLVMSPKVEELDLPQSFKRHIWKPDQNGPSEIDIVFYEEIKELMRTGYMKMKSFTATPNDVLNVSLSHLLFFGEVTAYNHFNHFQEAGSSPTYEKLEEWVQRKLANNEGEVLCNPALGVAELKLQGDADIIIGDELIDIKCHSTFTGLYIYDFIQLFIYACLYFVMTGKRCKRITIFNPRLQYEKSIDLTGWNNFEPMIDLLRRRVQSEATI